MIIAIDGHSACGKSTLAKDLAKHLNCIYIDSGAMYRAVTLYLLRHTIDPFDINLIEQQLDKINIEFIPGTDPKIYLNNEDVTSSIRTPQVSEFVSEISRIPEVRKRLVWLQRKIAVDKSVAMDGRDIGSVVFPNADIKIFLTADLETRTERRYKELVERGLNPDRLQIRNNLIKRDSIDSTRADSPLIKSPDAFVLDNSDISLEEQTKICLEWIQNQSI
jgi:cytidylate kinase